LEKWTILIFWTLHLSLQVTACWTFPANALTSTVLHRNQNLAAQTTHALFVEHISSLKKKSALKSYKKIHTGFVDSTMDDSPINETVQEDSFEERGVVMIKDLQEWFSPTFNDCH